MVKKVIIKLIMLGFKEDKNQNVVKFINIIYLEFVRILKGFQLNIFYFCIVEMKKCWLMQEFNKQKVKEFFGFFI